MAKAKIEQENEEKTPNFVLTVHKDEDLERARMNEVQKKPEEDFDEVKANAEVRSPSLISSLKKENRIVEEEDEKSVLLLNSEAPREEAHEDLISDGVEQVADRIGGENTQKKKSITEKIVEDEEKSTGLSNSVENSNTNVEDREIHTGSVEVKIEGEERKEREKMEDIQTNMSFEVYKDDIGYTVTNEQVAQFGETNAIEKSEILLQKLLREPRYFDQADISFWMKTCYACGEEGHNAVNCPLKKGKKPCYLCASSKHVAKFCSMKRQCYRCRKRGHRARHCPEKNKTGSINSDICLRCGESGHNMFSCTSEYPAEDLKEIKCYVCKKFGHLCCVNNDDYNGAGEIYCYNCGQIGHVGWGCAKRREEIRGVAGKCKEEGNVGLGCATQCQEISGAGKCEEEGHVGSGCAEQCGEISSGGKCEEEGNVGLGYATQCREISGAGKCGEKGHDGSGCAEQHGEISSGGKGEEKGHCEVAPDKQSSCSLITE